MNNKIEPFHFIDYEKIQDLLMFFNEEITLNFNVVLARKDKNGYRQHFMSEVVYNSNYTNKKEVVNIKRNMNYFLTINCKNDFQNSVMIRNADMVMFKLKLKQVVRWFTELYKEEDNKLVIVGDYKNIVVPVGEYKYIEFEPTVIMYDANTYKEGIRVYINSNSNFVDITIDKFMELYYIIDSMRMYECACILVNSLPIEYGENIFSINNEVNNGNPYGANYDSNRNNEIESKGKSKGNRSKNYFDK